MSTPIPSAKTDSVAPAPVEEIDPRSKEEIAARAAIDDLMKLPLKEREAKIASILDRGIINDRLAVDLPADLYGEWCRDDPLEIHRMETLGFWQDNVYAAKRAIHSDGSSASKIGDVRYMVCMRDTKNMIDKIMQERSDNNTKSKKQIQEEEREFMEKTNRDTDGIIPTFSTGSQTPMMSSESMDSVRKALHAANAQTVVKR